MMNTRGYFYDVREAVLQMRRAEETLEAKRQLCVHRARNQNPMGKGGVSDPTKRIDDLIEYEDKLGREYKEYKALEADAKHILNNYLKLDLMGGLVVWYRFLECLPKSQIAEVLDLEDESQVELYMSAAFDRMDSEGLPAIRDGRLWKTRADW